VQVQTDGRKTPEKAVSEALLSLHEEFTDIRNQFEVGEPPRATCLRPFAAYNVRGTIPKWL
jgi:hypothetical protein